MVNSKPVGTSLATDLQNGFLLSIHHSLFTRLHTYIFHTYFIAFTGSSFTALYAGYSEPRIANNGMTINAFASTSHVNRGYTTAPTPHDSSPSENALRSSPSFASQR